MYLCTYVSLYVCMYVWDGTERNGTESVYVYVCCVYVCMYVWMDGWMDAWMHAYTHTVYKFTTYTV